MFHYTYPRIYFDAKLCKVNTFFVHTAAVYILFILCIIYYIDPYRYEYLTLFYITKSIASFENSCRKKKKVILLLLKFFYLSIILNLTQHNLVGEKLESLEGGILCQHMAMSVDP